jgi:hypothetical protein
LEQGEVSILELDLILGEETKKTKNTQTKMNTITMKMMKMNMMMRLPVKNVSMQVQMASDAHLKMQITFLVQVVHV